MPTFKFGMLGTFLRHKEGRAPMASPKAEAGKQESILDIIHQLEKDENWERGSPGRRLSIDLGSLMEIQDASPVRKLVNMVMLLAIKDRASDIHFEPFEDEYKMRYRCDGVLYEMVPPPRHLATEIADRIKVMANLDIAERRRPQHGRIELNVGGNPVDMRVSVLPTMFGESVVIRVFDPTVAVRPEQGWHGPPDSASIPSIDSQAGRNDSRHGPDRRRQNHHALFSTERTE